MRKQAPKNENRRTVMVQATKERTEPRTVNVVVTKVPQKSYTVNVVVTKVPRQSRTIEVVVTNGDGKPSTQLVHIVESVYPRHPPASHPVPIVEEPLLALLSCKRVVNLGDDAEED